MFSIFSVNFNYLDNSEKNVFDIVVFNISAVACEQIALTTPIETRANLWGTCERFKRIIIETKRVKI